MAQNKALAKPRFVKVKELENLRNGYNVYVKVLSTTPKLVETRDGQKIPMVDCTVADETASAKAFFKGDNANLIQKGNIIAIRNGVIRLNKNHISLELDLFGRVTIEKDVAINPNETLDISTSEHHYPDRRNNNRREGDRPRNNNYRADRAERGNREDRAERGNREDRAERGNREDRGVRGNMEIRGERRNRGNREDRNNGQRPGPRRVEDRPKRNYNTENREESYRKEDRPERREGGDRREGGERRENRYPPRNRQNQQRRERNYNRDYDRREGGQQTRDYKPRNNYTEKRDELRGDRKPTNWAKISDIDPGDQSLNLNVKIISLAKVGPSKYRCVIGDSSGISNAFLPNRLDLQEGDSIVLFNAKSEVVKEHIEIQLGERGKIDISRKAVDKVSEEYNLSSKSWVPIE